MASMLLRGKYAVIEAQDASAGGIISNGAVAVEADKVKEVGFFDELRARYPNSHVLGTEDHLLLPGLVNAHHHGRGLSGVQLGISDARLEHYMLDFWRQHPLDIYLDTMFANIRMLKAGITTVIHSGYSRDWSNSEAEARATLRAYQDAGMRVAYALGVEDQNTFVYESNESFISRLPEDLQRRAKEALFRLGTSEGYDYFRCIEELRAEYSGNSKIKILFGPTGPEWCSPGLLRKIAERAKLDDIGIHLHCLESPLQHDFSHNQFGKSSVSHLKDLGILGPKTSLAHGVWLSKADLEVCAELGVSLCHNPSSNLRLHNGIAPVAPAREMGVNVGIGMDGWSLNNDDDLLQEMRLVAYLHRIPRRMRAAAPLTAREIFHMATVGGAKPSGFGGEIGSLKPGQFADAILVDIKAALRPYADPAFPILDSFLAHGRAAHIDTVVVGGEALVVNGKYLRHDESVIAEKLVDVAQRPPLAHITAFHQILDELQPYVDRFYEQWPAAAKIDPFYSPNSLI